MIPNNIYQTWSSKELPNILNEIRKHNIQLNNNKFNFYLWSDDEIKAFLKIHYPIISYIYSKTLTGVQRGDISRIVLLYHFGGIYMDLDMLCLNKLDNLFDYNKDVLNITYEPKEQTQLIYGTSEYICNAFFACEKNNPILKSALENIIKMFNMNGEIIFKRFDIFGGNFLLEIIDNYEKSSNIINIMDRDIIYPINDIKLNQLSSYKNDIQSLKTGIYKKNSIIVHYWIHGDFESKILINNYECDKKYNIHENVYKFFKKLYKI